MNRIFDRIFNLTALVALAMMMIPLAFLFLHDTFPHANGLLSLAAVLATGIGYAGQSVFARMFGKRASRDGYGSLKEGEFDSYNFKFAVIPLIGYAFLAVALYFSFNAYLLSLFEARVNDFYDPYYAGAAAILFWFCAFAGSFIWFYPVERLSSVYLLFGVCSVFAVETFFMLLTGGAFSGSNVTVLMCLPMIVFVICMVIVYSQSNLQKKYRGSVVSVITMQERFYTLFLVLVMLVMLAIAALFSYVILSGLYILLRILIFVTLYKVFAKAAGETYEYKGYAIPDGEGAGQMLQRSVMSPENQQLIAMFVLMILAAAGVFLMAKTGVLWKALRAIRDWIRDVIDTVLIGSDIYRRSFNPDADDELYNYKDEKKRLQNAGIRDYHAMAENTDTYKAFLARLGRLKTYDEQLCYAYNMLLCMYKRLNIILKTSDTPREVEGKVIRALSEAEIQTITADFERVHYAQFQPDDAEAAVILNRICGAVKRYLY